jgi:nucleotide-binding universal stress UspA family protein
MAGLIVIGYDGSPDAQRAIDVAGTLKAADALIVNVWRPTPAVSAATVPLGAAPVLPLREEYDRLEQEARTVAAEGVARAEAIGLRAEPVVVRGESIGQTGHVLAELADERDAVAIVVGRRGVSRLEAVLLGSVSDATVRAAHRPVLVAPAPDG